MVTKARVVDILAAGVDDSVPLEQRGCGPFDREGGPFNLTYGEGFDYKTENHLIEFFGFGNICTNWDYTPAREITAMVFPLFEYSMMIYLALNAINEKLAHNRGEISDSFYRSTQIFNPIIAFLCTMFRMIFVFIAYENPKMHTAGFLCLQLGLVFIAIQNAAFVIMTGQTYPKIGLTNRKQVALAAKIYLILLFIASFLKIQGTIYIVKNGLGSKFYKTKVFGGKLLMGKLIDYFWMPLNALVPLGIAWARACHEDPLTIQISIPTPDYDGECCEKEGEPAETSSLIPKKK